MTTPRSFNLAFMSGDVAAGARFTMGDRGGRRHERNSDHRSKHRDGDRDSPDLRERGRTAGSLARMERSDRCVFSPRQHIGPPNPLTAALGVPPA